MVTLRFPHAPLVAAVLLLLGCAGEASDPNANQPATGGSPNAQPYEQALQPSTPDDGEGEPPLPPAVDPPVTDPKAPGYKAGDKVMTRLVSNLYAETADAKGRVAVRVVAGGTELTVVSDEDPLSTHLHAAIGQLPIVVARGALQVSSSNGDGASNEFVKRALVAVGFSYYWGHGNWSTVGTTLGEAGTCAGSCPTCTHIGKRGADCSGLVAKVWGVPSTNTDITVDSHPYSTLDFVSASPRWTLLDRKNVQAGDALAFNSKGKGHMFIYKNGDGWGSFWSIEARGCSYGITYNLRTAGSSYKTLRKK